MADERPMKVEAKITGREKVREQDYLDVEGQHLRDADFSRIKLKGFAAYKSRFEGCSFEKARISDAGFGAGDAQSVYVDCSFDGARIEAAAPGDVRFERCSFRDVRLKNWFCWEVELVDCVFSGRGEKLLFNGTPQENRVKALGRERNEFRGNDFRELDLRDCAFRRGIDLTQNTLPPDPGTLVLLDGRKAVVAARREVSGWDDDERRQGALQILELLMEDVVNGQDQLYLRLDDLAGNRDKRLLEDLGELLARA
jgi:uncharacterized protein YjbI with pentapeptide repeats